MAGRGLASALGVWLVVAGGPGCVLSPQPPLAPALTIVDTTSPLPPVERTTRAAPAPKRESATAEVERPPPPDRTTVTPETPATEAPPAPAARPLSETDPFRTDSLDGNLFGRKLVKQILRPLGQEPPESPAMAPTDEP